MKIIPYYRVSTRKQGQSGLGLEAQKADVEAFVRQYDAKIVTEHKEIETGKKADRPTLAEAIGHAKLAKATLVVAKPDRLARNVAFTSALMESGVDFVACDNPHANRLTIHILAAVAEDEALRISRRIQDALAAAKARGIKLGVGPPRPLGRKRTSSRLGERRNGLSQSPYGTGKRRLRIPCSENAGIAGRRQDV